MPVLVIGMKTASLNSHSNPKHIYYVHNFQVQLRRDVADPSGLRADSYDIIYLAKLGGR